MKLMSAVLFAVFFLVVVVVARIYGKEVKRKKEKKGVRKRKCNNKKVEI